MNAVCFPGGLARIEQGRTRAPHHGGRHGAGLVVPDDVEKLVDVIETDDGHERVRQLGMIRGGEVARRLVEIEVEREQGRQQVVPKPSARSRISPGTADESSSSRNVWCGLSDEATSCRARIVSPSRVSTPIARPPPRRSVPARSAGGCRRRWRARRIPAPGRAPRCRRATSAPWPDWRSARRYGGRSRGPACRPRAAH